MNTISKKSLAALTFALSLFIPAQPLMALALGDGNDKEDIIISPDTMHNGGGHFRAPALVPICAAYLPHSSAIELEFLYNIGDVQVGTDTTRACLGLRWCLGELFPCKLGMGRSVGWLLY